MHDLTPAAQRLADLVAGVPDDALTAPTPCTEYSLGDVLDHVGGLAVAFTAAARKQPLDGAGPSGDASRLGDDWRTRIPRDVLALADAWRDPDAWTGMTAAGGIEMPGEIGGLVALDELVAHGWDVARALGLPYESDTATLEAVRTIVAQFGDDRGDAFGPEVPVPDGAPLLDRVIAMTGRDPGWAPQ